MRVNSKSFTLLELIIVIIIVGILASLGFAQYAKIMEKTRSAEAKANVDLLRKLAWAYYMREGTLTSLTNSAVGIGTDLPAGCTSSHYFSYTTGVASGNKELGAVRCTSGGKEPQWVGFNYWIYMRMNLDTGQQVGDFWCWDNGNGDCRKAGLGPQQVSFL